MDIDKFFLLYQKMKPRTILIRYIDFACALYRINMLSNDNYMLECRLRNLRDTVMKLLLKVSQKMPGNE